MKSRGKRRPIEIKPPLSLLLIPLLFVAGAVSIPVGFVYSRIQRHRERQFQLNLAARGRVIQWQDFMHAVEEHRGTAIEERYSLKGPDRWWWTPEKVRDVAPYEIADWSTMLKDNSFQPFAVWCRQRYTSVNEGQGLLVALRSAPRDEVRNFLFRLTESEDPICVHVVPPEKYARRPAASI